jgi:hypothetical protein
LLIHFISMCYCWFLAVCFSSSDYISHLSQLSSNSVCFRNSSLFR